jgi:hypothetical protein
MIDSIYYTSKLIPIPVEVIEKTAKFAIVKTKLDRLFKVDASRIIPLYLEDGARHLPKSVVDKRPPTGYWAIYEYLWEHKIELSSGDCSYLARSCGHACRSQDINPWIGKGSVRYFPLEIIDECYRKLQAKRNDEKNS